MTDRRHSHDYTMYLIGDHSRPEDMEQAAKELASSHDYEIVNPTRLYDRDNPSLLDRLEWLIMEADGVCLLDGWRESSCSLAEVMVAIATNKEMWLYGQNGLRVFLHTSPDEGPDCGEQA
jgi:hypothetical protein